MIKIINTTVQEDGSCASVLMNMNGKIVASSYVAGSIRSHVVQNKQKTNHLTISMKSIVEKELKKVLDSQSKEWHNLHNQMYSV